MADERDIKHFNKMANESKQRAANYMSLKGVLEPKQETTLEEAFKDFVLSHDFSELTNPNHLANRCFQFGAKWQQERMYSEEDLINFAHFYFKEEFNSTMQTSKSTDEILQEWFEQFKNK